MGIEGEAAQQVESVDVVRHAATDPGGEKPAEKPAEAAHEKPAEKDPALSARFAHLASQEQALQRKREQIAREAAELEQKRKAVPDIKALQAEARANPFAFMKRWGLTYEQLTDLQVNAGKPEQAVRGVQAEVEALKAKIEADRQAALKTEQERAAAEATRLEAEYKESVSEFVTVHAADYQLTQALGASDLVFQEIRAAYKDGGRVLSEADAAALVEKRLEDAVHKALGAERMKKLYQKIEQKADEQRPGGEKAAAEPVHKPATSLPGTLGPQTTQAPAGPETREQRRARMARAVGAAWRLQGQR